MEETHIWIPRCPARLSACSSFVPLQYLIIASLTWVCIPLVCGWYSTYLSISFPFLQLLIFLLGSQHVWETSHHGSSSWSTETESQQNWTAVFPKQCSPTSGSSEFPGQLSDCPCHCMQPCDKNGQWTVLLLFQPSILIHTGHTGACSVPCHFKTGLLADLHIILLLQLIQNVPEQLAFNLHQDLKHWCLPTKPNLDQNPSTDDPALHHAPTKFLALLFLTILTSTAGSLDW